jgi:mono/diheme cytochrome c family protein
MRPIDLAYGLMVFFTMLAVVAPVDGPADDTLMNLGEVVAAIPEEAKVRVNPVPASQNSLDHGRYLFSGHCAMCHGPKGDGNGGLARRLEMTMPDFLDPQQLKQRTDGELFYIITKGHGRMPADGERVLEEWRWDLVNAMREMAGNQK